MTVPGSGEISLGKIRQELESTDSTDAYATGPYTSAATSLSASETGEYDTINTGSANRPDGVGPFAMSEWRAYNHNPAWSINWSENIKGNFILSGSLDENNTYPSSSVNDQQIVSFTITNPSSEAPVAPDGYSWDNVGTEARTEYVYVYIHDGHASNRPGYGPYVDSGSVHIAMGAGQDPGLAGTGAGSPHLLYGKVGGTGWIKTATFRGTNKTAADFLDHDGSAPANDPPYMLNVARLKIHPASTALSASYYIRMAYSGSGTGTYGGGTKGVPGTEHSRSIHVINGPYSSSMDFKTTIVA